MPICNKCKKKMDTITLTKAALRQRLYRAQLEGYRYYTKTAARIERTLAKEQKNGT